MSVCSFTDASRNENQQCVAADSCMVKPAFHDADTNTDTDILADILARMILARMRIVARTTSGNRARRTCGEDPREDVGIGVVECGFNWPRPASINHLLTCWRVWPLWTGARHGRLSVRPSVWPAARLCDAVTAIARDDRSEYPLVFCYIVQLCRRAAAS